MVDLKITSSNYNNKKLYLTDKEVSFILNKWNKMTDNDNRKSISWNKNKNRFIG